VARPLKRRREAAPRLQRIELRSVSLRLGRHRALRGVDFELNRGERWLLHGANGAGKTVLLKMLRGDLWPTPGGRATRSWSFADGERDAEPLRAGTRIAYLGPERQDRYERHQSPLDVAQLVLTGYDDSDFPLQPPTPPQRRRIARLLAAVGLAGLHDRPFRSLSYGQRRRVLLARSLVRAPDVLLLDEALNGLDPHGRRAFLTALRRAVPPRTAWVLSTHRRADAPADVTHVAHMEEGRLVSAGPVQGERQRGSGPVLAPAAAAARPARATQAPPSRRPGGRAPLLRLERARVHREGGPAVIGSFTWELRPGEHWRLRGRNGAGKSTLIALLHGDLWPADGGQLWREPRHVDDWKRVTGLVSPELQARYAATDCTVEEIVGSGFDSSIGLAAGLAPARRRRVRRELAAWNLATLAGRRPRELSYGQLRRTLAARAFLQPRRLLLLDEPYDGLDALHRARFAERLAAAVRRGATLVIATHHPEEVPGWVRNELVMGRGKVPRPVALRAGGQSRGSAAS
jgi:molybdate transport system ATP-binding protein